MSGLTSMVAIVAAVTFVLISSSLVQESNAQAFAYNVSIVMGREKMEKQEGKLKLYLEGPGFRQKIPLSPDKESFFPGQTYRYLVAAPYTIDRIDGVSVEWTQKRELSSPTTWIRLNDPKIYVDSVHVDPTYEQNYQYRQSQLKVFCGYKRPKSVELGEIEQFKLRC